MALSASEMVTLIDEAIETLIEGGKSSVTIRNRSYTFNDIGELRNTREYYNKEAMRTASTSPRGIRISSIKLGGTP